MTESTQPFDADTESKSSNERNSLSASNITVHFGGLAALSNVEITVPRRSTVGLVGPNGAGKSTLFGVLSGLTRPQSGRIILEGEDVTGMSAQARARRGMARTFQHPELFSSLTVREHVVLAHRMRHSRSRLWKDLFTGRGLRDASPAENDAVNNVIDLVNIGSIANRPVRALPLGMAKMVEVARAIATDPKILLLDEPGAGLDTNETEQLARSLLRIMDDGDISLLLVEHDLGMVLGMSDLVYVLDFGICIAHGTPSEIRMNSAVQDAYLGDDGGAAPEKF